MDSKFKKSNSDSENEDDGGGDTFNPKFRILFTFVV